MDQSNGNTLKALDSFLKSAGIEEAKDQSEDEFTMEEIAERAKMSRSQAQKLIYDRMKEGTVTRRKKGKKYLYRLV